MQRNGLAPIMFMAIVMAGFACEANASATEATEILKITVGEPTKISDSVMQNTASLAVSRTGVVAAFYPQPGTGPHWYRTSTDGGLTWGPQMDSPSQLCGNVASATLRDGGVVKYLTDGTKFLGEAWLRTSPMEGEFKDGWFMLHSTFAWFNDDFTSYKPGAVSVYMPDAVTTKQIHLSTSTWPIFAMGKILQLDNGDLLAPMYGVFKGDTKSRVVLSSSSDRGHKWRYYATVATGTRDPNPELPGQYNGPCEPSIALLGDGQMISVFRTQYSHLPGAYRPISVCWSNDLGKTWTKPVPTKPHLMNIAPMLAVLDNGVVACAYGRPGFHVAFSLDKGHTWQDRISFSDLPCDVITGQFDMIKVGPNRLLAVGNDAEGTKVWPLSVDRLKVSTTQGNLHGRVLSEQGVPIANATIERSPNRYTAADWLEDPTKTDPWYQTDPLTVGSPKLSYRSIRKDNGYPTVQTDAQGHFRVASVKLGEYVLTVEADGYAPQHRHIKVEPGVDRESEPQDFRLKAGKKVCSQVVDDAGRPVPGACVVLNRWHIHTDSKGSFHWSVEAPVAEDVKLRVYKRYSGEYQILKGTVRFSQIVREPIVLRLKR